MKIQKDIEESENMRTFLSSIGKVEGVEVFFTDTDCKIVKSRDEGKWHLSIAHLKRYPTWDEIKQARYDLLPDNLTMAMLLPPKDEYVNVHSNCFHLHEIDN